MKMTMMLFRMKIVYTVVRTIMLLVAFLSLVQAVVLPRQDNTSGYVHDVLSFSFCRTEMVFSCRAYLTDVSNMIRYIY